MEARIFALALGCIHQGQTKPTGIVIPLGRVLTQKKGGSTYDDVTGTNLASGPNGFPTNTRLTPQSDGSDWIVISC